MIDEVQIGRLREAEIDAVVNLAHAVWHAHYPGIISSAQIDYMLGQRYKPALIRQLLARGDAWFVARAGASVAGFAHVYALGEGDCKLDKLYVAADVQRHGVGALLLERAERYAREHAGNRLVLRVNRHNAQALAAYRKYGFTVATEIAEDIGNGFVMDDFVMTKDL